MSKPLIEKMYELKHARGQTDFNNYPEVLCQVCQRPKVMTWHAVDTTRGFWTDEAGCSTCTSRSEREQVRSVLRKRFDKAGVPPAHQLFTLLAKNQKCGRVPLPECEQQEYASSLAYSYKVPQWLCFSGPVGVGKTTLLSALMCDAIAADVQNRSFLWTTESGLFKSADLASEKSHAARMRVMEHAAKVDLLMIDDLASNRRALTDWQGGAMRDLIDERHNFQRGTLFTSNLTQWQHLESRYGTHIVSRMIGASTGIVTIEGSDLRFGGQS